jgi:aryl-alcohol dehydrogenase-like predicted oxidoreductase
MRNWLCTLRAFRLSKDMTIDAPQNSAPASLNTHKLGNAHVNPIGFGAMNMCHGYGMPLSQAEGHALLHAVLDAGYTHIDTARIYGYGLSETWIGEALKPRRKEFTLASKMGIFFDGPNRGVNCRPEVIKEECEKSLKALQTDHIDLYYMHRRDFNVPIEDSVGAMADLVKQGKIGGYGLSEMSAETLRKAHAVHPCHAVQSEYALMTRQVEIAVIKACAELGVTFVAFSPFGRGYLADRFAGMDVPHWGEGDLRGGWPRFLEPNYSANRALVESLKAVAAQEGVTPAQLALGWVLAQGEHIVTIPGTRSIAHAQENIVRSSYRPSADICAKLDALINHETTAGPRYTPALQASIDTEEFAA